MSSLQWSGYEIYNNSELVIKHHVNLAKPGYKDPKTGKKITNSYGFQYNLSDASGVYFNLDGHIKIEQKKQSKSDEKMGISLGMIQMPELHNSIIASEAFFKEKEKHFAYNAEHQVIGVLKTSLKPVIQTQHDYLGFRHVFITDTDQNRFEAVQLFTSKGAIGTLTEAEFYTVKLMLLPVINNLFLCNMTAAMSAANYTAWQRMFKKKPDDKT